MNSCWEDKIVPKNPVKIKRETLSEKVEAALREMLVSGRWKNSERILSVWGDRIFEKCGIGRDEGGDGGKTLEIRGKRRLSARDGGANYQQS